MNHEHEAPYTAGEVIREMQSAGVIPAKPAPAPRHRHRIIMAVAEYMAMGACLGLAAAISALLILQLMKLL